jgi:DNA polymerase
MHDFRVGYRGLMLDKNGIETARQIVEKRAADLEEEFERLTGFSPGQVARVKEWCLERGVELPNLQKGTLEELLEEGTIENEPGPRLTREVRRALELRTQHARASTKKLDAMMRQRGRDGRARFQTRFHGAGTGRNTGTGFQPLNLVRSWEKVPPEQLVRDIAHGDPRFLDMQYGDAMTAISKALRHYIIPDKGNRIIAGDFSSIEAVVNACLAGEEWKVQLFRDKGDPYVAFASQALGRKVKGKKDPGVTEQDLLDRQDVGKPGELAAGYQGWINAWRKFDSTDKWDDDQVAGFMRAWRESHPMIVQFWRGLEDAALEAVAYPGRVAGYRDIGFERVDGWLTMILPDGKRLWYWAPQIRMAWPSWHRPIENEDCAAGECDCKQKPQVTYMAQKEGRWRRVYTYGGKLVENAVQAVSRQLLKPAELRAERYGYPVILSVYDEIVAEVPIGRGSADELREIMEEPAGPWCETWPVRADVWEGARYRK